MGNVEKERELRLTRKVAQNKKQPKIILIFVAVKKIMNKDAYVA